ncbi:hypothetical protein MMC15_004308 [Xylographa vitiligo]|nr:hypothetical protein [Xylographa vitiligo]
MAAISLTGDEYPLKTMLAKEVSGESLAAEPAAEVVQSQDEAVLAYYGKRQQLRRNFGLLSVVGLTCTILITWEGILSVLEAGLLNGGPSGLIYGFIFAWVGSIMQVLTMAEMGSMIPLAGGQYNWVAILAPPSCSKFLSYLTGWITIIAWQAGLSTGAFLGGTLIQGLLILNNPNYTPYQWQGTLLFYAIIAIALFVNTYLGRLLPKIESLVLVVHICGFFAILIPLVYFAPHVTAADVFQNFSNIGGWNPSGLSFFIGLTTSMLTFTGLDAACHIAEEIENAAVVIPRSMCISVILNGVLGFSMLLALLFCLGDLTDALATTTGYPFIEIFYQATGSTAGASAMTAVIIVTFIFEVFGLLATASRMTWAFAREDGLPFSSYLARIEPRSFLPLWSIGLMVLISCILALINIGSTTAFYAFVSLVIAAFYSTFLIAACALLHKRLTTPPADMHWGPFKLGHVLGTTVNVLAILYSVIGIFFSFWPPTMTVTAQTMNWSVAVFGGVIVFAMIFWFVHGRKVYTGPIVEIDGGRIFKHA